MESIVSNISEGTLIFDVVTILVLLIFFMVNYHRGFTKTVVSAIGYILAILIGGTVGNMCAEPIYNNVLKQQNISNIEEVLKDCNVISSISERIKKDTYGVAISEDRLKLILSSPDTMYNAINNNGSEFLTKEKINKLLGECIEQTIGEPLKSTIPSSAVDYAMNTIKSNEETLYEVASLLSKSDKEISVYLEENLISPIVIYIIKIALFIVVFFIVMIIVKVISNVISDSLPQLAIVTDKILGGITGLIEGFVLLLIVCIILKLLVSANVGLDTILSLENIQNTIVFKHIYNIDILDLINQ